MAREDIKLPNGKEVTFLTGDDAEDEMPDVRICEYCGERPGTHLAAGYDCTPTDRGEERRYYEEWLCDECDPER